jgi:hypothetical protein
MRNPMPRRKADTVVRRSRSGYCVPAMTNEIITAVPG